STLFFIIRPPPSSPLLPYTTLFRSLSFHCDQFQNESKVISAPTANITPPTKTPTVTHTGAPGPQAKPAAAPPATDPKSPPPNTAPSLAEAIILSSAVAML